MYLYICVVVMFMGQLIQVAQKCPRYLEIQKGIYKSESKSNCNMGSNHTVLAIFQ